jgi:hypothetical protein
MAGYDKVIERTPETFTRRQGDWVAEGANNTILVLGTDRARAGGPATGNDGLGTLPGAGSIAIIAGRHNSKGHPDFNSDDAFVYLSMKTNVDANLAYGSEGALGRSPAKAAAKAVVLKSDNIRAVFRDNGDVRIANEDGKTFVVVSKDYIDGHVGKDLWIDVGGIGLEVHSSDKVKLGPLADALADLAKRLTDAFMQAGTVSMAGNLGAPVPFAGSDLQTKVAGPGGALDKWKSQWIDDGYIKR